MAAAMFLLVCGGSRPQGGKGHRRMSLRRWQRLALLPPRLVHATLGATCARFVASGFFPFGCGGRMSRQGCECSSSMGRSSTWGCGAERWHRQSEGWRLPMITLPYARRQNMTTAPWPAGPTIARHNFTVSGCYSCCSQHCTDTERQLGLSGRVCQSSHTWPVGVGVLDEEVNHYCDRHRLRGDCWHGPLFRPLSSGLSG